MFKFLFIAARDALFNGLSKRKGEKYAEENYRLLILTLLYPYYILVMLFWGLLQNRLSIPIPEFVKTNFVGFLIGVIVFNYPYYLFAKWLLVRMDKTPIDKNDSNKKTNKYSIIAWIVFLSIFLLGIVFLVKLSKL